MTGYAKPLPEPDADSRPFWDACRKHELRAQQCTGCGRFRWPPQGVCPSCHSWDHAWARLPGTGKVLSFVVVHYVAVAAFSGDVPYVIAQVELDGTDAGVILTSNVIAPWEQIRVGIEIAVVFEDVTPDCTLPKFRPVK